MAKNLSNRQRTLDLGISSYTEGSDVLTITGNTIISGIVTAIAGAAVTYYGDGSNLTGISAGLSSVVQDTTPQLGGDLDVNGNDITGTGNINLTGVITATSFVGDGTGITGLTAGQVGALADIVTDTTPQLGGDLDVNGNDITGTGNINLTGIVTASSFIKSGGTSSQFLKADGSVDSSTYITSADGGDADQLDGQEGTYYLDYNNFTNTPTIPTNNNELTNGAGYITSSDNITGTSGGLSGSPSITVTDITAVGNVSIAGTLTYEDVTSVDSIGIVTARTGVKVTTGGIEVSAGGINITGVSTFQGNVNLGVGGTTAFFDVDTGNVGIGSTQPDATLTVNINQSSTTFTGNVLDVGYIHSTLGRRDIFQIAAQSFRYDTTNTGAKTAFRFGSFAPNSGWVGLHYGSHSNPVVYQTSLSNTSGVSGVNNTGYFAWTSGTYFTDYNSWDLRLYRDDAGILAQRNETNPNTFRVYNTYTSSTNFERANVGWTTDVFIVGTEKGVDGGSPRQLELQTDGTTRVAITTDGNVGIASTQPTATLDVNGTLNVTGVITATSFSGDGSALTGISAGLSSVVEDTTPQLGGNLDINGNDITGTGNVNVTGVVTATSFEGDGSNLTNLPGFDQDADGNLFAGTNAGGGYDPDTGTSIYNIFLGANAGASIANGDYNTFLGYEAGCSVTTGINNIIIGCRAGCSLQTGSCNVFLGKCAAPAATGSSNFVLGPEAGKCMTSGSGNILITQGASADTTTAWTGSNTVAIGKQAGRRLQGSSNNNVFLGKYSGLCVTTGGSNIFIGDQAGCGSNAKTGSNNVVMGTNSGANLSSGACNVFLGYEAGNKNTTGINNIFLGFSAGCNNTSGNSNTFLGLNAGSTQTAGDNNIVLGCNVQLPNTTGSDQLAIGSGTNRWIAGDSSFNVTVSTASTFSSSGVVVSGIVTATDFNSASDAKLKTNVQIIPDPLEKVLQINGVSFNWIKDNKPSMGVIADNIQEILPELVSDTDPKTVNYNGLIGLLIEVVKELDAENKELKERLTTLEEKVNSLLES